jgi:hypothetical protein
MVFGKVYRKKGYFCCEDTRAPSYIAELVNVCAFSAVLENCTFPGTGTTLFTYYFYFLKTASYVKQKQINSLVKNRYHKVM